VPGGRIDFLPVRGDAPRPAKGAAIHLAVAFLSDPAGAYIETDGLADVR
jgi:hypothetical protein